MAAVVTCPRCRVALHFGSTRSGPMYGCGHCGGIWLDRAMSERLTSALDSDTLALADSASQHARTRVETSATLACPSCGAALARRNVANARAEVDSCASHGTWFDRDELQKVARGFAAARAYGAPLAAGAAVAGGAALGAGTAGLVEQRVNQTQQAGETGIEIAGDALETGVDVAEAAAGASDALELAGGAFEILGGIFEALG
jgi:Zn-finger nucleic acid-binding protein